MKKILVGILAMTCALGYITAQNVEDFTGTSVSHWSFGLKGGANYFRVVPSPYNHPDENRLHLIIGGTVDYSINPLAGIGVELLNNPYGSDVDGLNILDANTIDVVPYFSVNLSNLLFPYREGFWRKVNIFSETGAGVGFYNYSLNNAPVKYGETLLAKTGINAEYNFNKHFALALEGQYRYYDRADLGGRSIGKGFCEALAATVGLRIKLGANRKQHARNMSMPVAVKAAEYVPIDTDSLESIERGNAVLAQKLKDMEDQLSLLAAKKALVPPATTAVTSFQAIEFKFDSSKLTQASIPILNMIAEMLKNASWSNLTIYGNADSTGPSGYNQTLSEKRANTVKKYLVHKEVPASKINSIGNGEEKPIATNKTPEGRQKNRRVDFGLEK